VAQPGDPFNQPSLSLGVRLGGGTGIEPIDSLQVLYDNWQNAVGLPEPAGGIGLILSPNPVGDQLTITWPEGFSQRAHVRVVDAIGHEVLPSLGGRRSFLDVSGLPAGSYVLMIEEAGRKGSSRFVKL
jgi:hypothetical protein